MGDQTKKKMKTQTVDTFVTRTPGQSDSSDNQQNRPSQSIDPDAKEEAHKKHSFEYRLQDIKKIRVTCDRSVTVLDALKTSKNFRDKMKKNEGKEIVIERGKGQRAAFNTQSPCHLIDDHELLTISFIRAAEVGSSSANGSSSAKKDPHYKSRKLSDEWITFNVETKGGAKIINKVMKNPVLKTKVRQVCVSAYKGERVRQALKRDGRFAKTIFTKGCVLSEPAIDVTTEMSSLVDDLEGRSFQVTQYSSLNQPDSQDCYVSPASSSTLKADSENSPQQSTTLEPKETHLSPQRCGPSLAKETWHEIPNSNKIIQILRSQFADSVEHMKTRENLHNSADVQCFLRKEFGKNTQNCLEVKRVKKLMRLSASVCQVRIDGTAMGTGFLLFENFVLTNGHVVNSIYDQHTRQLQNSVTVTFEFEDLGMTVRQIPVKKEVVAYEYNKNVIRCFPDMALLELKPDPAFSLPPGLLSYFSFPRAEAGICIIGHPEGGVKKIDPCIIIKPEDRAEAAQSHYNENMDYLHVISERYFMEKWDIDTSLKSDNRRITYDSCFFHGASGSPVFDEHCQLIAMHTAGYAYKGKKQRTQSVIEYAIPLSLTLESIVTELVLRGEGDVINTFRIQGKINSDVGKVLNTIKERIGREHPWFNESMENSVHTQQGCLSGIQQGEVVIPVRDEAMDVE